MSQPRQWNPARGCGRPIPLPTRHPPAGILHSAHIPGRGTIPPTDHAPGICGRHGGGDPCSDPCRQPLPTTPGITRATKVLHAVTNYLEGNQLLVHNLKSATMVQNAPPPPLRPGDPPMNPVSTATYLGVQQAATASGVTLPPNVIRQPTRTHSIARIVALSTQALAYYRVPGLAPSAPPTNATGGHYHGTASVDHPQPPTHITTCGGTRGIATILRGQHRWPRQKRVHSSHRDPPAPSHAQS